MRTVAAAFVAVSESRFDDAGALLAEEIDWRGLPEPDGGVPRCAGRATALDRMRIGWLANGQVAVSALEEEGDRVLARVHRVGEDELRPAEHFVVAEVHGGRITRLGGYATEAEARQALTA
jgi:ketosteroid isomerase-like protein